MPASIEDNEFDNLILDGGAPPALLGDITAAKKATLASIYFAIMLKEFKKTFKFSVFPLLGALNLIGTLYSLATGFKNKKNKNAEFFFNMGMMTLFCVAELAATVIALIVLPVSILIVTPITMTVIASFNTLRSLGEAVFHLMHLLFHKQPYSMDYAEHKQKFQQSSVGFFINSLLLAGCVSTFLSPYIPAIAGFFGVATIVIQSAIVALLSASVLSAIKSKVSLLIKEFNKNKSRKTEEGKPVPLRNEIRQQYEQNFNSLDSNVYDLKIKMQVLLENDEINQTSPEDSSSHRFIKSLIDQEKVRLEIGLGQHARDHIKFTILEEVEQIVEQKKSISELVQCYNQKKYLKDVTRSYFAKVGGMQKILVVAHQYGRFFDHNLDINQAEKSQSQPVVITNNANQPTSRFSSN